ncbi:hypothetical protein T472_0200930 [Youngiibacter fragilis 232.1]|jgi:IS30 family transposase|uniref:Uncharacterized protein n=1 Tax=Youngiibacter fragilis 232.1 TaxID=994573 RepID=V7IAW2_9CLOT|nr:hypothetical protein T472_0200930 [Youngiibacter fragilis 232.1]
MIAHSRILAKRIDEIPAAINDMYEYRHWKNNCVLLNMTKEGACSLIAMVNRQYKIRILESKSASHATLLWLRYNMNRLII